MKKLLKTAKYILIFLGLVFVVYGFYLRNLWSNFITDKELTTLITDIRNTESVNERYYFYYDKLYPNALEYSSNRMLLETLLTGNSYKSPNQIIPYINFYEFKEGKSYFRLKTKELYLSLAWKLEREGLTQKQCLNYLLKNQGYLFQITGIKNASQYYFEKDLDSLNDREIATLVLMGKNPRMYNPKREISQKKLADALDKIMK